MFTNDTVVLCTLTFLCILLILLLKFILKQKNKKQLHKMFIIIFNLMLLWLGCMALQLLFMDRFNIPIKYFFDVYYVSLCFLPVAFLFMALSFENNKVTFKKSYLLLFIIPILTIILMWTNDFHHLMYKEYSIDLSTEYGWYFYVHTFYTYLLFAVALFILIRYSIKNAGFFSKQAILILIGVSVPLVINVLGSLQLIEINIYTTPSAFAVTIIFFTFAIFKFDLFKITPIALQRIVDRISDSYVVINENYLITDFNETFIKTFKIKDKSSIRGKSIEALLNKNDININAEKIYHSIEKIGNTDNTEKFELYVPEIEKHFNIEITSIIVNKQFFGTLILFKDITQHVKDLKIIEENQNMLIEKERLASLGQMIGGIAHNLKTPIMSVAGASEGLSELIKEIDLSVGNPTVTVSDYHEITKEMNSWIEKIRAHMSYMSDVITSVKGQAVSMSEDQIVSFKTEELLKRVNILMKHELQNALVTLNIKDFSDKKISITGNINSLVQVINNMISNSIQAYNGKENAVIDLTVTSADDKVIISIKDYACGMPDDVKSKLFTQMVTTKGKNGTGLGLFMSYSNIKAHFNGDITFTSELNKGTEFKIILPITR